MNGDDSLKSNHNSRFRPGFGRTGFGRDQSYPNVFCFPQFFIAFCSMFVFKYSIIPLYIYMVPIIYIYPIYRWWYNIPHTYWDHMLLHLYTLIYIYPMIYPIYRWFLVPLNPSSKHSGDHSRHAPDASWHPPREKHEITGEHFAVQGRTVLMVS